MGRAPCCDKANVKKGPWSPEEDVKLKDYIEKHGTGGNWIALPQKAGLKRCGKSCRLRWLNYLRPNIKHGEFSDEEDRIICTLYASIGSRWSIIAAQLPGRTDNDIKNYWNTKLKKKLMALTPQSQRKALSFPSHHHPPPLSSQMSLLSLYKDSSSSSSSYPFYNTNPTKLSFTGFEPIISTIPSNLFANMSNQTGISTNTSSSVPFQTQQGFLNSNPMIQFYHQPKDKNCNLLVFGSTEASSSTSNSDGSCSQQIKKEDNIGFHQTNYNNIGGFEDNQKFMLSYGSNGENLNQWGGGADQKGSGYLGENQLDYDLEDVKQLISSGNNDNNNSSSSNLNLMIDENKTQEKLMYYYYY